MNMELKSSKTKLLIYDNLILHWPSIILIPIFFLAIWILLKKRAKKNIAQIKILINLCQTRIFDRFKATASY